MGAKKKAKKISKKARKALKKANKAKAVVKKVIVKAKKVFVKIGHKVRGHAKLMKIKVHVNAKDCKCTPHKKVIHKVGKPLKIAKKAVKKVGKPLKVKPAKKK